MSEATNGRGRRGGAITTLVIVAAMLCGCGGSDAEKPLRFGILSTESTAGLQQGFEPFLDDMSKSLGVRIQPYMTTDYSGLVEGMRFGKVDIAWLGNKVAAEAADRAGAEVFAQTVAYDGSPGYWAVVITHKNAKYKTIDEIVAHGKELTFGTGDANSTSGYLIPNYYLWMERGIDPLTHFKRTLASNHGANLEAVAAGRLDFATNNTENLSIFEREQPEKAANIVVIWKSPLIAGDPLVWRKDLPEEMKTKLREFVLAYGRGEGAEAERQLAVLKGLNSGWGPFRPSSNRQLLPIREIMVSQEIQELKSNTTMSEPEKAAKLKELETKLASLRRQREDEPPPAEADVAAVAAPGTNPATEPR